MRRRLGAALMAALIGLGSGPVAPALVRTAVVAAAFTVAAPDQAEARRSGSSGGYSRPGGSSGSTRTPSFGDSSSSSSGGYARPGSGSAGSSGYDSGYSGSGSDRSASRGQSRSALDDFLTPETRTPSAGSSGSGSGGSGSGGSGSTTRRPRSDDADPYGYYGDRGYRPPDYASRGRSSFGVFDAVLLWYLLDTISDRSHADFFRDNRDDPGYREWRAEADAQAQSDPELKAKLAALDRQLAAGGGDPARAGQVPADVPDQVARARGLGEGPGMGTILIVVLIGGFVLFMMWKMSRPRKPPGGQPPRTQGGDGTMLGTAAAILRNKASGAKYQPDLFRVGMPLTLDPAPFILAEGMTKVTAPKAGMDNGRIGVDAIGTVTDGAGTYHRLYLEDEGAFFQLVLDAQGNPSECRYFKRLDEIQPADKDEWGFWLDKTDGMIGWPEFETKDGQRYARAWSPGSSKVPPRDVTEAIENLEGTIERKLHMMLYARKTGRADPAPAVEYLLVTAVDAKGEAWVELHAGIDINPSALSLS
ncbi:DUF2491 family protein [Oleomonas cavernae]|uniref:DUF2491 family protein n=1 Tax=Oleomonas cavernae TaxID=2320859 RepID=A0A418WEK7_9PROT|nr:DUF2491 family protein [Oleomonas cavernae]